MAEDQNTDNTLLKKKYFSKIALGLLLIICVWYGKNLNSWGRDKIITHDVISYYAYLPAAIIFRDFSFKFANDTASAAEVKIWYSVAQNGKPVLRMTMGLAILWLPFFLSAHLMATVLGVSTMGYSWPYSFFIFIAAVFYLFMGLVFLRKILLKYFTDWITAITLIVIVAATNLMYYVISEPGLSHVYSFALISIFLWVTLIWISKPTWGLSILAGVLGGLIVLIRPVNGLVLIFPLILGLDSLIGFKNRIFRNWQYLAVAAFSAIIMVLPQIVYWKIQTGHFLFNSYMESGKFYFLHPNIFQGLLGFRKGWLIYTPVMLFSIYGFFVMKKFVAGLRTALIAFMVLFIYVVFSWWCWWYGGSFGSRPMIETYGILAIPLAASFAYLFKKNFLIKVLLSIVLVAFLYLNQFQMGQYRTSLLHWDSMTKEAYKAIFFRSSAPTGYESLLKNPDYEKALKGDFKNN
jgi:hypothetical protein